MRFFDREKAVHVFLCLTVLVITVIGIGMTYKPVYVILVDGQEVIAFETEEEAQTVLERVRNSYETDLVSYPESDFKEAVTIQQVHDNVEVTADLTYAEKLLRNTYLTVVTEGFVSETEPLTYEVEYEESDDLYLGQEKVIQEGKEGSKVVVKEVQLENGVVVSEKTTMDAVIDEPKNQVVLVGTKEYPTISSLMNPVSGTLSSRFGIRWNRQHNGVDIAAPAGTPIYAAEEGVVTYAQYNYGGYGYMVKISHGNGVETRYAHCSRLLVSVGDTVQQGDPIALVGSTGRSTGNHLHFEIRINGEAIDPLPYLTAYGGSHFETEGDPISLDDLINGTAELGSCEDMADIDADIITKPAEGTVNTDNTVSDTQQTTSSAIEDSQEQESHTEDSEHTAGSTQGAISSSEETKEKDTAPDSGGAASDDQNSDTTTQSGIQDQSVWEETEEVRYS